MALPLPGGERVGVRGLGRFRKSSESSESPHPVLLPSEEKGRSSTSVNKRVPPGSISSPKLSRRSSRAASRAGSHRIKLGSRWANYWMSGPLRPPPPCLNIHWATSTRGRERRHGLAVTDKAASARSRFCSSSPGSRRGAYSSPSSGTEYRNRHIATKRHR
jgi:hypothetical protein